MRKLSICQSKKLEEFMAAFPRDMRFKIAEDTFSSWIDVDVFGRYGWVRFSIWKATDKLYALDQHGAAGDDPIPIAVARRRVDMIPKHRSEA